MLRLIPSSVFGLLVAIALPARAETAPSPPVAALPAVGVAPAVYRGPYLVPRGRGEVDVAILIKGAADVDAAQFHLRIDGVDSDRLALVVPSFIAEQARSANQREQSAAALVKFVGVPRVVGKESTYAIVYADTVVASTPAVRAPATAEAFSFLVYGDMREAHHSDERPEFYIQEDSIMPPTFAAIGRYFDAAKKTPPRFQLLTGDLLNLSGDTQQWNEFLAFADLVWKRAPVISAMGNHEGQGAHREKSFISNFGNLFYFNEAHPEAMNYADQTKLMQRWFDVGGVRFVNFPVIHELAEVDYLYGLRAMPPELVDQFLQSLRDAAEAKKRGEIQFIVVYSHVPLIGSPMLRLDHRGMGQVIERAKRSGEASLADKYTKFIVNEFHLDDASKADKARAAGTRAANLDVSVVEPLEKIAAALVDCGVDAWFNGHNHLYQRLSWNKLPLVTVGIGTELDNRAPTVAKGKMYDTVLGAKVTTERHIDAERSTRGPIPFDKKIPPKKRPGDVLGFLRCNVPAGVGTKKAPKQMTCELLGARYHADADETDYDEDGGKSATTAFELPKLEVMDKFTVKSRTPR